MSQRVLLASLAAAAGALALGASARGDAVGAPAAPMPVATPPPLPGRVVLAPPCPSPAPPTGASPSARLREAFAILRRPARPGDALPREALDALRRRGLVPADVSSARLLRTTPQGGRAWVVPVPDVGLATALAPCAAVHPRRGRPAPRGGRRPALPAPAGRVRRAEGLAVVALGDAPAGGGGALADLVRGRAPVAVDPCAGPDRDMLGVSGIVPDGVGAAFLTAPDGTAVRADVTDNGYAFVVPHARWGQLRYVVWTGGNGTPHVQPVPVFPHVPGRACPRLPRGLAQVTPSLLPFACSPPSPARRNRRRAVPCPVPALPAPLAISVAPPRTP